MVIPADHVFPLPADVSPEVGALIESLTVAWHAVRRSGAGEGTTALVIGAGPIGLGLLLCLQAAGASTVVVSEPSESRRALAAELGADPVDPRTTDVAAYVRGRAPAGADVSFDASGAGTITLSAAIDGVRSGGQAVIVANSHHKVEIISSRLTLPEAVDRGIRHLLGPGRDSEVKILVAPSGDQKI
ncbi:zinc-binding dehydrogenase [Actinoplanes sp. NPDC026619]|uniref:zinc-binding dehydrogenase n=1 Tax=Actinoplanes sp. NPDC026619 TaxID=3155798 RepID=UPI0033F47006